MELVDTEEAVAERKCVAIRQLDHIEQVLKNVLETCKMRQTSIVNLNNTTIAIIVFGGFVNKLTDLYFRGNLHSK